MSWLLSLLLLVGCGGSDSAAPTGPPPPPPDSRGPTVEIVFPPDSFRFVRPVDEDGDGLMDLRVRWSDAESPVDVSRARITIAPGTNGGAGPNDNLLDFWTVDSLDATGALLHETIGSLLHPLSNRLVVSVADAAGNVGTDTLRFSAPLAAFHKTIVSGLVETGIGITVCPDDRRVCMTAGKKVVVASVDSLKLIGVFRNNAALDLAKPLCIPGDPVLYVTDTMDRFDRSAMVWLPEVAGSFLAIGITQSKADPNLIYAGESGGIIGIIDRALGQRIGHTGFPFSPFFDEAVSAIRVLSGDRKIYSTRFVEGGLVVSDTTGTILRIIDLSPAGPGLGRADNVALSPDERHLYAPVVFGNPLSVVEIDTQTDSVIPIAEDVSVPIAVALNSTGRRMFLTTQDLDPFSGTSPSELFLIDPRNRTALARFPRPRPPGEIRFELAVTFGPDDKRIFVAHNSDIDVYLNRE